MNEQDETLLNVDDAEGHAVIPRGEDEDEATDTEGHAVIPRGEDEDEADDTEGHYKA